MKKYQTKILARNKAWDNATVRERKLMICEDVLSMLKSPVYNIEQGTYCSTRDDWDELAGKTSKDIQEGLLKDEVQCTVCARGAMMVSKFRFKNTVSGEGLFSLDDQDKTQYQLKEAFTKTELDLIESIFEQDYDFSKFWGQDEDKFEEVINTFSNDDSDRLQEIMERIISCDGDVMKALTCDK